MKKPNILMIVVDQLTFRALGRDNHTPNLDALLEKSMVAENCTCQCPLCQPSRASFWSSLYPHQTNVLSNGKRWPAPPLSPEVPTLGKALSDGGYETRHFGKKHDAGALSGFVCNEEKEEKVPDENPSCRFNMDTYADVFALKESLAYLNGRDDSRPLAMVVDLINPHGICGWVGMHKDGKAEPDLTDLPSLPENFLFDDIENRGKAVEYLCCSHIRQAQASHWSPLLFRQYMAAYQYYLSVADGMIGEVLDAWKRKGLEGYILFTSDHGDNYASRGMVTKQVGLYEECVRVPFAISGEDIAPGSLSGLMELLDLAPTVCTLAGVPVPSSFQGLDLSGNFRSGKPIAREYAVSAWHTEWGFTVSPCRMVRTKEAKYIVYREDGVEEYYDLVHDPYEKRNVASSHPNEVMEMRKLLDAYCKETGDPFFSLECHVDKRWRSHELGFCHHEGPAAPEVP
jgi:choline-sulfatase